MPIGRPPKPNCRQRRARRHPLQRPGTQHTRPRIRTDFQNSRGRHRGHRSAIRRERRSHPRRLGRNRHHRLDRHRTPLPQTHLAKSGRRQPFIIRAKGQSSNHIALTGPIEGGILQAPHRFAGGYFQQTHPISPSHRHRAALRIEGHCKTGFPVLGNRFPRGLHHDGTVGLGSLLDPTPKHPQLFGRQIPGVGFVARRRHDQVFNLMGCGLENETVGGFSGHCARPGFASAQEGGRSLQI